MDKRVCLSDFWQNFVYVQIRAKPCSYAKRAALGAALAGLNNMRRRFWQIGESEQKLRTPPPGEQILFTVFFLFIEQNAAGVYVFAIKQKT